VSGARSEGPGSVHPGREVSRDPTGFELPGRCAGYHRTSGRPGARGARLRSADMTVGARKDPGRVAIPQYSARAVFEAVVNAVAHRDYSVHGSKIRLFLFDDRLELYSPGPLPNTVTIESIALRQSTRNELITTLLAKCPVEDPAGEIGRRFLMEK